MLRYTILPWRNKEAPGYSVVVPGLPGCFSQGSTYEEAVANTKEAIECHLEGMVEDGEEFAPEDEPFVVASVQVEAPRSLDLHPARRA